MLTEHLHFTMHTGSCIIHRQTALEDVHIAPNKTAEAFDIILV